MKNLEAPWANSYVGHYLSLSYLRLNTTVEYAQVCCSILVSILITNYMMLGSGSTVYTTEIICCWSALVQYDFWGIHDLCNTLHIFIPCSCVPPRIIKSPATDLWLYIARLTPTLSCLHDFVCLICILLLCTSDFDDTCMRIASVLASLHILNAWVMFPLPGSAHNFWRCAQ